MKFILSPTKTFDFTSPNFDIEASVPHFINSAISINSHLKHIKDIAKTMKCSDNIADEVSGYIHSFQEQKNPAIFSYSGAVFKNMNPLALSMSQLQFLQDNLTILSGMYGALKPLDEISKYRLEMQQKLPSTNMGTLNKGLYHFWSNKISSYLHSKMSDGELLINLASNEYFKVIEKKIIKNIVSVEFKESKSGDYKVVGTYAKMARGKMVRFIAENRVDTLDQLKKFDVDRYRFNEGLSTNEQVIFTR